MLALVGAEGGGIHYRGPSSCGKSTLLQAAGSVFGGGGLRGWVRSWRATDNALESVAAAHCDLPLLLDEMGEAGADTVAAAAYMLADVVVSASTDPEAFGRVVAEAQAMGRPVVAPDHGGAPEI
ncbi:MAG: DUF927 domain-containing protein, partial [Phycisphaerae bacterium]